MSYRIVTYERDAMLAAMLYDIRQEGLKASVKRRLDEINDAVKNDDYLKVRFIQEQMSEVLDLIDVYMEDKNG